MNKRLGVTLSFFVSIVALLGGCNKSTQEPPAHEAPAHVEHHVEENALNRITLTEQAEQRLGIQLAKTVRKEIRRKRQVGGEVMVPPGKSIIVTAPVTGTLSAPQGRDVPTPGSRVVAGQAIFSFIPMLTPERNVLTPSERVRIAQTKADVTTAQIEAQRQIESARVTVEAFQIAYDRAVQLLNARAGSQRNVDEAHANLQLAQEALTTAQARYEFLSGIVLDESAGELASYDIESPVAGLLQDLGSAVGETVAAGELLFSVITTQRMWVRVPIYVGQWRDIDTSQPAMITEFGQRPGELRWEGQYVSAPPSANPLASTVDVYYELGNEDADLRPGQVLNVTLPLKSRATSLVIPFNAVLYDIHGGTWVYQLVAEHVYARIRVSVEYVDDGMAVLVNGPEPDSQVVTDGAVELFGTEFGVGH